MSILCSGVRELLYSSLNGNVSQVSDTVFVYCDEPRMSGGAAQLLIHDLEIYLNANICQPYFCAFLLSGSLLILPSYWPETLLR